MKCAIMTATAVMACFALGSADAGPAGIRPLGIPGTLTSDGVFQPHAQHSATQRKASTLTGTLTVTVPFTIVSQIGKKTPVLCIFGLSVLNTSSNPNVSNFTETSEFDQAPAAINGTTGTCSFNLPFQWQLQDAAHDSLVLSLSLTTPVDAATNLPAGTNGNEFEAGAPGATANLPANNKTTDLSKKFANANFSL